MSDDVRSRAVTAGNLVTVPEGATRTATWPAPRVALFLALLLLSVMPVLLVDIPAGADVPNHLARMGILAAAGTAGSNPHYEVDWALVPNLALDLLVPRIAGSVGGVEAATKVFYLVSQLAVVTGAVALELVHKRRFELSGFVALLFLYSVPFAWGFLNFMLGTGLALWGMALFELLRMRALPVRLAGHALVLVVLFVTHLVALGLYGVVVGLLEFHRLRDRPRLRAWTFAGGWLALPLGPLLIALEVSGGAVGSAGTSWDLKAKALWLLAAVNGYHWLVSLALTVSLAVLVRGLVRRGSVAMRPEGTLLLAAFAMLFAVMPLRLAGTAIVDVRVVVVAALVLPAFVTVGSPSQPVSRVLAVGGVVLVVVNALLALVVQLTYERVYADIKASFAAVAPGSTVLVAGAGDGRTPPLDLLDYPLHHAPTLVASARGAFVPSLFATPGKQPLVPAPAVRDLYRDDAGVVPLSLLEAVSRGRTSGPAVPEFLRHWESDYDYVYVLGEPAPDAVPAALRLVEARDRFAVYRVVA